MQRATVTIDFRGYEITGIVRVDDEHNVISVKITDAEEDAPLNRYADNIEEALGEAAVGVVEAHEDNYDALDYHDDEDQYEGYESDFDSMWNG